MMSRRCLATALRYAAAGWPVLPCKPGGKTPLTLHGVSAATIEPEPIRAWWSAWPAANVAVATGHRFDVLDIDPGGYDAHRELQKAGLLGGAFRLVRTPRGGLHVYLPPSGDGNHTCARRHVDYRGLGGYVLAPPSLVDGKPYQVITEPRGTGEVLDWRQAMRLIDPRPAPQRPVGGPPRAGLSRLAEWVSTQPEGNRNPGLFWAACCAVDEGYGDLTPLVAAAETAGLPRSEAERTVASALRRRQRAPL